MSEWIYKIYLVRRHGNFSDKDEVALDIVDFNSKREVLDYVGKNHPEYFPNGKVAQRLPKDADTCFTCTIFELNDYYRKVWYEEMPCAACNKSMTRLSIRQEEIMLDEPHQKPYFCPECQCRKKEYYETRELDYWSKRSPNHYIYKITNKVNGKIYIGYSSREVVFRWWEHLRHSDKSLGFALKEEGIKNFTFEVLEQIPKTEKTREEMLKLESFYMNEFNSIKSGYNAVISIKRSLNGE